MEAGCNDESSDTAQRCDGEVDSSRAHSVELGAEGAGHGAEDTPPPGLSGRAGGEGWGFEVKDVTNSARDGEREETHDKGCDGRVPLPGR